MNTLFKMHRTTLQIFPIPDIPYTGILLVFSRFLYTYLLLPYFLMPPPTFFLPFTVNGLPPHSLLECKLYKGSDQYFLQELSDLALRTVCDT